MIMRGVNLTQSGAQGETVRLEHWAVRRYKERDVPHDINELPSPLVNAAPLFLLVYHRLCLVRSSYYRAISPST